MSGSMVNTVYGLAGMVFGVILTFSVIWAINPKTFRQRLKKVFDPTVS